jgi:predicted dehydrogenase
MKSPESDKAIRNLIIIGCGLHFCERYYEVLQEYSVNIAAIVDLVTEKKRIENFFNDKLLKPDSFIYLDEQYRNKISENKIEHLLADVMCQKNIEAVLICTEPKVHMPYALWAIKKGMHVFMDKPLSAFDTLKKSNSIVRDINLAVSETRAAKVNFVLSCERRLNQGYEYVLRYLRNIIEQYHVPVTAVDIHFGGGMWNMPPEFFSRENHPYKYGYGVLLHSGYHYIDLLLSILNLNKVLEVYKIDKRSIKTNTLLPSDNLKTITAKSYKKCLHTQQFDLCFEEETLNQLNLFGEVDIMVTGQCVSNSGSRTLFSVSLIETSASGRSWAELPDNTYTQNGRIRQDNIIIHVGPVCSVHIRSLSLDKKQNSGKVEDFSIDIINNKNILATDVHIKVDRTDLSELYPDLPLTKSLNIVSRQNQLLEFLNKRDGNSHITSHLEGIELMGLIFESIKKERSLKKKTVVL